MRPAGRSSPGRRPRRLPGRRPAAVCRSCPRRTNSARQTGLRFAGLIRVIERAVELAAALSLPGGAAGPHDELPVDPAADGVHDLVRGVARCRSCRLGLVQVEGLHGGVAVQHGEQRPLRDSGHPWLGSARGLSTPPQLPGRVALAEQVVGRCFGRADPAGDALNVYRPAPGRRRRACPASARRHPARRVARQGKPGRFARNDTASALRRLACHVPADRRLHARAKGASSARAHQRDLPAGGAPAARGPRVTRTEGPRDRRRVTGRGAVRKRRRRAGSECMGPGEPADAPAWRTEAAQVRVPAAVSSPWPSPPVVRPSTSASARPRPGAAPRSSRACASRPP